MRSSRPPPGPHLDDVLPDLALGAEMSFAAESHVAHCDRCTSRFLQLRHRVPAMLDTVRSLETLRVLIAQVLAEIETEGNIVRFAPEIADLLGLPEERAWELLERLEDPTIAWHPGPAAGITVLPLKSGTRWRGTRCVALRGRAGAEFPLHVHDGNEHQVVVQGGFRDGDGLEVWRGESLTARQGTSHALTMLDGPDCIAIVRIDPPC